MRFLVPNLLNDMHGTDPHRIQHADTWLYTHLGAYVRWAQENNSLLIVTWDEGDWLLNNHIPTILIGPMVIARTRAGQANPMTDMWKSRQEKKE